MTDEEPFRWICLTALLLNVGCSAYYRRKARQDGETIARRAEGGLLIAMRLLVALPLLAALVAYVVRPAWMAWAQVPLPGALRWIGGAMALLAAPLVWWVLRSLGRNVSETVLTKASHELVMDGPYRRIRHPLYTAGLMMLTGVALLAANAFMALLVGIGAVMIVRFVIPREETALLDAFGVAYQAYRRRTGRLLPTFSANRT